MSPVTALTQTLAFDVTDSEEEISESSDSVPAPAPRPTVRKPSQRAAAAALAQKTREIAIAHSEAKLKAARMRINILEAQAKKKKQQKAKELSAWTQNFVIDAAQRVARTHEPPTVEPLQDFIIERFKNGEAPEPDVESDNEVVEEEAKDEIPLRSPQHSRPIRRYFSDDEPTRKRVRAPDGNSTRTKRVKADQLKQLQSQISERTRQTLDNDRPRLNLSLELASAAAVRRLARCLTFSAGSRRPRVRLPLSRLTSRAASTWNGRSAPPQRPVFLIFGATPVRAGALATLRSDVRSRPGRLTRRPSQMQRQSALGERARADFEATLACLRELEESPF